MLRTSDPWDASLRIDGDQRGDHVVNRGVLGKFEALFDELARPAKKGSSRSASVLARTAERHTPAVERGSSTTRCPLRQPNRLHRYVTSVDPNQQVDEATGDDALS